MIESEPRICAYSKCDNPVLRRKGEAPSHYAARETCCLACTSARRKELSEARKAAILAGFRHPPCENPACRGPVEIKPREPVNNYMARLTCCPDCANALRAVTVIKNQAEPEETNPTVPDIEPDFAGRFGRHNLHFRRSAACLPRPETHVPTMSGIA